MAESSMKNVEEELLIPKDLNEAKELVNKLSIEDLKTFCFTFGLSQDGTKASLKERLLEYYKGKLTLKNGTPKPVPTPRKRSTVESEKEAPVVEIMTDVELKLGESISFITDQLRKSDQRIDQVEFSVNKMGAYVEESLSKFRESLTEAIKDSTEKMMRSFDKPSDDTRIETDQDRLAHGSKITAVKRRLNFLEKNAECVCNELEKLMNAEAAPARIERQLKKLNEYESDCIHSVEEVLASVEDEKLMEEVLHEWDVFHSQILRISGRAEDFIAKNGVNTQFTAPSEFTEHVTGVKLPLLQLPKFSGNVLEWPAFHDAFIASVDSHRKLSNVQKFTHLRSCLSGRAFKCIEGYSVTNDNYSKAFQDLKNRFGRKRLLANELVKSILVLDVPENADGKSLRDLYDTLRNRMRSLESLGLKPDDNPSLSMVLLPIFDTKLPRELKEKWELELTKYETEEEDKEINIKKFFQFWEGHVLSKEAPDDTKGSLPKHKRRHYRVRRGKDEENMSAQSLMGASESKRMKCGFCGKNHETSKCPVALTKTSDERWEMLMKRKGAPTCFNCLQPGSISHNSRTCKAPRCSVDGCGKKHHQLLHSADQTKPNDEETQTLSGFVSTCKQNLLPTACARMIYEGKECSVRILLDSGSQETFVRTAVADNLNMRRHGSPAHMKIKVLGGQEQHKRMNRLTFKLSPLDSNDGQMISIDAWTINNVCGPLAAVDVDVTRCNHLQNLKLADNFPRKAATVDLLVGADQYYKLVQGSIKRGRPGTPVATKSRLGWLLSGPVPGSKKSEDTTAMLTVTKMYNAHDQLKRFWELEAIGIVDQQRGETTAEEKHAVDQ